MTDTAFIITATAVVGFGYGVLPAIAVLVVLAIGAALFYQRIG